MAILQATHSGVLKIGAFEIPCAVLEDGTRLLTQEGFLKAIGRAGKAKGGQGATVDSKVAFLAANNLKPFVSEELAESTIPIVFRGETGVKAFGYKADLLPLVCNVYLEADEADKTLSSQEHIVQRCKILVRGLAIVGINALVDEATGYQEVRDKQALQQILDKYLLKEQAKWAKRFPDDFYRQMFRLRNWRWKGMKINRPSVVGTYTNDLVYSRLAPGVLEELRRLNPKDEKGRRKGKLQQWLTEDVGHPALSQHLHAILALMRSSNNWDQFKRGVERAFPKFTDQMSLLTNDDF